jgi:hypothetical protein
MTYLSELFSLSRQLHWKQLCLYGRCKCFDEVHDEFKRLEAQKQGVRK